MTEPDTTARMIALLRRLRAVRDFRPDPIPEPVLDDLLQVMRWTGSARNKQPWEAVVVRERTTLEMLARLDGYAGHLARAPLGIVLVMGGDLEEQETFDEGRLAERLMLAAAAHGVGACIGWFRGQGRTEARTLLRVPAGRVVRTAISFGYPDEAAHRARSKPAEARKPLDEIVHQERYRPARVAKR
jgi:nitroreductase